MKKTNILVFDGQSETLLTMLSNKDNEQCPYFSSDAMEQLNKDFTLEFSVPASHEDSRHLVRGNLVGFFDLDGNLQVFQVYKTEESHDGGQITKAVFSEHIFYEMADDIVTDLRVDGGTALDAMTKALSQSRWNVGQVDDFGTGTVNFYYSSGLKNIQDVVDTFGGELGFRIILNGNTISDRLVDLKFRRGADTGHRFEFTQDLQSVKRTEQLDGLKTALYGRGKGEEIEETGGHSRKITFSDVVWRTIDGKPVDKPSGQEWVGLPEALAKFGREGGTRHRFGIFDVDSTDPQEILEQTFQELQRVSTPKVTYELKVITLEQLTGYDHKKVRLGDTVFVIDRDLGITIEARVIEIKRDLVNPENTEVVLGNFIDDIIDFNKKIEEIESTITDRKGVWDKVDDISVVVDDSTIVDSAPPVPTNISAQGLFKSIVLKWTFNPSISISAYEVFASKVPNFTPDSTNLVFRGKTGGFILDANTNETWYFRMRTRNTHDRVSAYTQQFQASTIALTQPDFENLVVKNAMIENVSADKVTFGTLDGNKATIVNIDADNIVAGKLKAQFVEIGSTTTFGAGYDPTTKATPQEVLDAEARAKSHADTKDAEAKTALEQYAVAQAEAERIKAESYADGIVSDEEQARIEDAQAKLEEAKTHADNKAKEAETASKTYADTKLTEAQQYADTKKQEAIDASELYAKEKAEAERVLAEIYADGAVSDEEQARIQAINTSLASAKTYADEKKQEAIQASEGLVDGLETEIKDYTKPVMKEFFDAGFQYGKEFWSNSYAGAETTPTPDGTIVATEEAELGGNVYQITGQKYLYSKNAFPVNVNRTYRVTIKVRQTVDATVGGSRVFAGVSCLDENFVMADPTAPTPNKYFASNAQTITVANGWQIYTGLISGIGSENNQFLIGTRFVRPMFVVNNSDGNGTVEVDYLEFEDVTEMVTLDQRVTDVEFLTTQDSIIQTVTESVTFKEQLGNKADQNYVDENFATNDAVSQTAETIGQETDQKIADLKVPEIAQRVSNVEQTAEQIDFKFTNSGGVNLLRNSVGYAEDDFWFVANGSIQTLQNNELAQIGAGSGWYAPVGVGGQFDQTVSVVNSNRYTLSFYMNKTVDHATASGHAGIDVYAGDTKLAFVGLSKGQGTTNGWEKFEYNIDTDLAEVTIRITMGADAEAIITNLMLNIGDVPLQWTLASGEVYNTNVLMDMNGVRVISNQYEGYTAITPSEFSGYAEVIDEVTNTRQMKRVFTLNRDTTEVTKIKVEEEVRMSPLKMIPVQAGNFNGWAFVPED
jgi:phage minor structural protein